MTVCGTRRFSKIYLRNPARKTKEKLLYDIYTHKNSHTFSFSWTISFWKWTSSDIEKWLYSIMELVSWNQTKPELLSNITCQIHAKLSIWTGSLSVYLQCTLIRYSSVANTSTTDPNLKIRSAIAPKWLILTPISFTLLWYACCRLYIFIWIDSTLVRNPHPEADA